MTCEIEINKYRKERAIEDSFIRRSGISLQSVYWLIIWRYPMLLVPLDWHKISSDHFFGWMIALPSCSAWVNLCWCMTTICLFNKKFCSNTHQAFRHFLHNALHILFALDFFYFFLIYVNVSTLHSIQLLIRSGRTPEEALMLLVPEAYKNHPTLMIKYPEVLCFFDICINTLEFW